MLAASNFGQIRLWDDQLSKLHYETPSSGDWSFGISFSPDGKVVGFGRHDMGVHLRDAATGKESRTLLGHASTVDVILFAPDNKTLVSSGRDGAVRHPSAGATDRWRRQALIGRIRSRGRTRPSMRWLAMGRGTRRLLLLLGLRHEARDTRHLLDRDDECDSPARVVQFSGTNDRVENGVDLARTDDRQ